MVTPCLLVWPVCMSHLSSHKVKNYVHQLTIGKTGWQFILALEQSLECLQDVSLFGVASSFSDGKTEATTLTPVPRLENGGDVVDIASAIGPTHPFTFSSLMLSCCC